MPLTEVVSIPMSSNSKAFPSPKPKRGTAVRVKGLAGRLHKKWARACALNGESQSEALANLIEGYVVNAQTEFGSDLFNTLTPREKRVRDAVRSGACRVQQVAEETGMSESRAEEILDDLNARGYLDKRRAIKATEQARGATVWEYFLAK